MTERWAFISMDTLKYLQIWNEKPVLAIHLIITRNQKIIQSGLILWDPSETFLRPQYCYVQNFISITWYTKNVTPTF